MNNILKKVLLAPLLGSLVLGSSSCSSATDTTMPHEVKENIEHTMGEVFTITKSSDFMSALANISDDKDAIKEYPDEMDKVKSLVADDANVTDFVTEAKKFMTENDDADIKVIGQSSPFMSTFYAYSSTTGEVDRVLVDPSGFEKQDGSWVPKKNGALGYLDKDGRYLAFSGSTDNISFTEDGDKLTLASLVDEMQFAQQQQTDTYVATEKALAYTLDWLSKAEPKWSEKPVDLGELQNEALKGFEHPEGMKFKFNGTTEDFTLEVVNEKTDEVIMFESLNGSIQSNKDIQKMEEFDSTEAYTLYYEYVDEFLDSVNSGKEEYASLDETIKLLESNDKETDAKWSSYGDDENKTVVVRKGGHEYKFPDITNEYSGLSYGGEMNGDMPLDYDSHDVGTENK